MGKIANFGIFDRFLLLVPTRNLYLGMKYKKGKVQKLDEVGFLYG
jgi:hypothetical protein